MRPHKQILHRKQWLPVCLKFLLRIFLFLIQYWAFHPLQQKPHEATGEDKRGDHCIYFTCPLGQSDWTAGPAAPNSCCHQYPCPDSLWFELSILTSPLLLLFIFGHQWWQWTGRTWTVKLFYPPLNVWLGLGRCSQTLNGSVTLVWLFAFQTQYYLQRNTEAAGRGADCGELKFSWCLSAFYHVRHLIFLYSICFLFQRPVPLTEIKVSPPKFDLAATNFPPLPGCVVSTQGEPVLENRMSDVVRGLYKDKVRQN